MLSELKDAEAWVMWEFISIFITIIMICYNMQMRNFYVQMWSKFLYRLLDSSALHVLSWALGLSQVIVKWWVAVPSRVL